MAAQEIVQLLRESWLAEAGATLEAEMKAKAIRWKDRTLRFEERVFGTEPESGHSLFISMHGGGGAPKRVNDSQWRNQVRLYEPEEGIYVAPRAPTDTWNLWHQAHIDHLFDRLISAYVALRRVDVNRVYLLGYSAGGDGVYQLAPRMADRFAAAAMMAGHPNEARPLGLRNIGFAMYVGGKDTAYKRNEVAVTWGKQLAALKKNDPDGYAHKLTVYEDCGHWMKRRDREALPWLARFTRTVWPKRIAWYQDDVTHDRFYWLALPKGVAARGQRVTAEVQGRRIHVTATDMTRLTLRLCDDLLDLDEPLAVLVNEKLVFSGVVPRSVDAMVRSLEERADGHAIATAYLDLTW